MWMQGRILLFVIYTTKGVFFLDGFGAETISGILAIGKVMAKF